MRSLTRRLAIGGGLAASAAQLFPAMSTQRSPLNEPLAASAAQSGRLYGCAVSAAQLERDRGFADLVGAQAAILVPEAELKRYVVQVSETHNDFSSADAILSFAAFHGQKVRGHTLVWYYGNPGWLEWKLREAPKEALLTDFIGETCRRYRGRMHSWDVVNELVAPEEGHAEGLCIRSPWYAAFGDGFIATAFHAAREADPSALLFYGDYDVEMAGPAQEQRRTAVLKILERLKRHGAPIDAFGVQGHLKAFKQSFDEAIYSRFLDEIAKMGIKLMVTEFDVADRGGPSDVGKRDAEVAAIARRFLDVSLDKPAMLGVMTWGLSDRYSWLSYAYDYKWPDGQLARGLPFDGNLRPKPMQAAIIEAFEAARSDKP